MPTRRAFLGFSGRVFLGLGVGSGSGLLAGCGGGGDGGASGFVETRGGDAVGTQTPGRVVGSPIYPLFAARNYQGHSALFFGTRDASGAPQSFTQSIHWDGSDTTQAVRILYDTAGYPAQLIDETTGAFLALFWDTAAGTVDVQSYSNAAVYQGGIRVTIARGAVTGVVSLTAEPTRAARTLSETRLTRGRSSDELNSQQEVVAVLVVALLQLFLRVGTAGSLLTSAHLTLLLLSTGQVQRFGRALELWYVLLLPALLAATLTPTLLTMGIGRGYGNLEDYYDYSLFRLIYRAYFYNTVRHLYLSST